MLMDIFIVMYFVLNECIRKDMIVYILSLIIRLLNFYKGIYCNNNCYYLFIRFKILLKFLIFVKFMYGII